MSPDPHAKLRHALQERASEGNLRSLSVYDQGIDFYSNDYLGLASSGELRRRINQLREPQEPLPQGSTGSRLVSGNSSLAEELEQQRNLFERKIRVITQLQSRQENAVIIMDELSKHLPNWLWLTELAFSAQEIRVKGRAVSNNLIADYIFNLEESSYFRNVNLISSQQRRVRNNQYLEFVLTSIFVGPSLTNPASEEATEGETK